MLENLKAEDASYRLHLGSPSFFPQVDLHLLIVCLSLNLGTCVRLEPATVYLSTLTPATGCGSFFIHRYVHHLLNVLLAEEKPCLLFTFELVCELSFSFLLGGLVLLILE